MNTKEGQTKFMFHNESFKILKLSNKDNHLKENKKHKSQEYRTIDNWLNIGSLIVWFKI